MSKNLENMSVDELCKGFSEADKQRVQSFADDSAVTALAQTKSEFKGTSVAEEKLELVEKYIAESHYG